MPLSLEDWLRERHENCLRLAEQKVGAEREGWLEDAAYFSRAMTTIVALRSLVGTWEDPGPMGTLYQMPRAISFAKSALGKT